MITNAMARKAAANASSISILLKIGLVVAASKIVCEPIISFALTNQNIGSITAIFFTVSLNILCGTNAPPKKAPPKPSTLAIGLTAFLEAMLPIKKFKLKHTRTNIKEFRKKKNP